MKTKEKKIFSHPFLNRWTIPGVILITLAAYFLGQQVIGSLIGFALSFVQSAVVGSANAELSSDAVQNGVLIGTELGTVFAAFLLLSVYWRWFYPEYRGSLPGENMRFWMIFAGVTSLIVLAVQVLNALLSGAKLGVPPAVNLCAALMAGCFEEAVFRGISASYLMRQWPGEKGIVKTMILSSVLFGLVHAVNVLGGAPLAATVIQILNAFGMGMFLCAVFLRSGSLWPGIIIHVLFDAFAFMDVSSVAEGGVITADFSFSPADMIVFIFIAVTVAAGLYLVRPAVRGETAALWNRKWNRSSFIRKA